MKKRIVAFLLIVGLLFSFIPDYDSEAATTGWHHDKTGWWYVTSTSGSYVKNQWKQIGGVWYFFKSTGYMAANEYVNGYWLNKDGSWTYKYKASWKKDSTGWWFGDSHGYYAKNTNLKINDVVYHFDKKGYNKAEWVKRNNKWSYIKANATYTVGLSSIDGAKYYFDSNGYMLTGWQTIKGKKYYFITNGRMNTKSELTISGTTYLFDSNGVCKGKKEPVHQHTMKEEIIEPTCTTDGYTRHYCTTCDYSYNTDTIKAHHDIVIDKAVPATCTVPGKTQGEHCTKCNYKVKQKMIPATGHSFTDNIHYYSDEDCTTEISKESLTCDMNYWYKTKCDNCDTWTEVIYHTAGTHTREKLDTSEASTCTVAGHNDYKCSVCGYTWSEDLELADHNYGEWTETKHGTCTVAGEEKRTCSVCGKEETRTTSTDPNNHYYKISDMANVRQNVEDKYVATTCDPNFETYWEEECEWCHNTIKHTVEHLDHNFNDERKYYTDKDCTQEVTGNLNCEKTYYYKTKCTNCDTWSDVETKPAGKHSYKVIATKEATCQEKGYIIYKCDICEDEYIEYKDKKPHNFTGEVKYYEDEACTIEAPKQLDCETTYYYKTKCINCDTWSDVEIREAGQHNWINDTSKEDIKSTCKTPGTHYKKCSICGKQDTDPIALDPDNHEGEEVSDNNAVAATCKTKGKTASTHCSACNNIITPQTDTPIDPDNHENLGEVYNRNKTYYILDDSTKHYTGEAGFNINDYKDIEHHWWVNTIEENKYYITDADSYNTCIDVTQYWKKVIGIDLDKNDYTTWIIEKNPLIIAGAELNGMTVTDFTNLLRDYYEHPKYITNFITYNGVIRDGNSQELALLYEPTGSGDGDVEIRRYTKYKEYHYYQRCSACKKEIEVDSPDDEMIDYPSGTAVGEEWEEEHYIRYE